MQTLTHLKYFIAPICAITLAQYNVMMGAVATTGTAALIIIKVIKEFKDKK